MYIWGGTLTVRNTNIYQNTAATGYVRPRLLLETPIQPPLREASGLQSVSSTSLLLVGAQGGGMQIYRATVSIMETNIYSNQATHVCARLLLGMPF